MSAPTDSTGDDAAAAAVADAATYDLTPLISPYLDLHMMFPLLEYIDSLISSGSVSYSHVDVAQARLELLKPTHMVDYAMDIYREVHGEDAAIPADMEEQKAGVFEELEGLREGQARFDELCRNEETRANLVNNNQWNVESITSMSSLGITSDTIDTYYKFAKFNFDCGDYQTGRNMIENYISLFASPPKQKAEGEDDMDGYGDSNKKSSQDDEKTGNSNMYYLTSVDKSLLQVLWGKLSCEILVEDWEEASVALVAVKTAIESLASSRRIEPLEALHQRTWLLHWSLFVFWNDASGKGLESMVDLFTSEKYLQAVTTHAPHLLRYLTAAVLLCKRRAAKKAGGGNSGAEGRRLLRDLVKVMQQCEYSDPIVEFVEQLSVKFDFEAAQSQLARCETVLSSDFFLCRQTELFMEEARVFVFENYCRIHHKIDLTILGQKLAMDRDRAERWIVDLIRNALLDAKIDSEEGCVVMGTGSTSVHEQVMERTKELTARSGGLVSNLRGYMNDIKREKVRRERKSREEGEY